MFFTQGVILTTATGAGETTLLRRSALAVLDDAHQLEVLQLCRSALISWADMVLAPSVAGLFKWCQFEPEMILLVVGW